jgi:hypothetical protein
MEKLWEYLKYYFGMIKIQGQKPFIMKFQIFILHYNILGSLSSFVSKTKYVSPQLKS